MPFADAVKIADSFRRYPPVFILAAVQAGVRPDEGESGGEAMTEDDARALRGTL